MNKPFQLGYKEGILSERARIREWAEKQDPVTGVTYNGGKVPENLLIGHDFKISAFALLTFLSEGEKKQELHYTPAFTIEDVPSKCCGRCFEGGEDRKSTRLNSSHIQKSRMPSSA